MFIIECDKCGRTAEFVACMGWIRLKSISITLSKADPENTINNRDICPECHDFIQNAIQSDLKTTGNTGLA
jgi:Fe2+ or Zn2+ uptake regulation protein